MFLFVVLFGLMLILLPICFLELGLDFQLHYYFDLRCSWFFFFFFLCVNVSTLFHVILRIFSGLVF